MKTIYFNDNEIINTPFIVFQNLKKVDDWFNILHNNPVENPPKEIIEQGKEEILAWFAANKKELKEIKVLLTGEAEAGKTSLLRRLLEADDFNENEPQTDGITIKTFDFETLPTFKKQKKLHGLKAHFWDFGGQEVLTSTHQFFMSKRSVYLLILDARNDKNADAQVRSWLKRIEAFGGNSPVLVVTNKIEVNEVFGLNTYELQKSFPQIKGFLSISCKENTGLEAVKDLLAKVISEAELFKTEIDEKWFPVKEALQKDAKSKRYLNENTFLNLCKEHQVEQELNQNSLIEFLNALGIVLHFSDLRKRDFFVLDPHWLTTGIYRIITSSFAAKAKGEITLENLHYIVNQEEGKKGAYIPEEHKKLKYSASELQYLSEIMAEFKLSYFSENREKILIPDLLSKRTTCGKGSKD